MSQKSCPISTFFFLISDLINSGHNTPINDKPVGGGVGAGCGIILISFPNDAHPNGHNVTVELIQPV